ncbi:MAG: outer membrane protein assembly factor BamD [Isosphaeraceae bacterium]
MPLAQAIPHPSPNRRTIGARPVERRRPRHWRAMGMVLAGLAICPCLGCQNLGNGTLAAWRTGLDSSLSKGPTARELGDDRSLMARWLKPGRPVPTRPVDTDGLVLGSDGWKPMKGAANPEADAEFQAAQSLFQRGDLAAAETAFSRLATKRKGTSWGEKGQFHLAETQFQRRKFVAAHESFEKLMADYPGTEFNDKLVQREFEIANLWLAQSDPKAPAELKLPWYAPFTGEAPLIDFQGHAIRALDHVRHHNPTGPLADDAVMKVADVYMANQDYESAALYYDQLISDHAKSPFLQRAQLAAIDARMKGYLGPEYDGTGLEKARELVKQTMATFPDRLAGQEDLYHTLDLINDQDAERTYSIGQYYQRTGKVASAEFYYGKILHRWPKSEWGAKAKTHLAELAKMPRAITEPSKIMTQPGSNDPILGGGGMGPMGGMGGMGMGGMGGPGGMN